MMMKPMQMHNKCIKIEKLLLEEMLQIVIFYLRYKTINYIFIPATRIVTLHALSVKIV